jgi:Iap family predicted aminopeptidase
MLFQQLVNRMCSGGNLGWAEAAAPPPPPPTFVENNEFSEILTYKKAKNSLFECKWGGGFVRNLKVLLEI